MVAFDTSTILYAIDPATNPPIDPSTGALLTRCPDRINYLIKRLTESETAILIATPVLSEFLVKAGPNKHEYLDRFLRSKNFTVGAFDQLAAIEIALLNDPDLSSGKKLDEAATKAKVKFDRQVVAIAKVQGADTIYTDDERLAKSARANGIKAVLTWELPLPPENPQIGLWNGQQPQT